MLDNPQEQANIEPAAEDVAPVGEHVPPAESAKAAFAALAAKNDAAKIPAFAGKDGWLHLNAEIRHLGKEKFWGDAAPDLNSDPFHAIVDLHNKLTDLGIDFIFAPVPPRAIVYPETVLEHVPLNEQGIPQRLDVTLQAFYSELREAGVNVVDVTDAFMTARQTDATDGPVCCPQDTHWSPRGIQIAAEAIFNEVGEPEWMEDVDFTGVHILDPKPLSYMGDLVQRVDENADDKTDTTIYPIAGGENGEAFEFNRDAPVLLLSDSHGLVFSTGIDEGMHSEDAGFGEALSAQFFFPIDRESKEAPAIKFAEKWHVTF